MAADYLRDISAFILGGGFVAYFTKYLFDRYLAIELEKHKGALSLELEHFKHNFVLEVERFKEKLHENALEHEVKFSRLHEERAQIIKELFQRILKLSEDLRDQTIALSVPGNGNDLNATEMAETVQSGVVSNRGESDDNGSNGVMVIDIVTDELIDFYNYFSEKKIYFSNELTALVEQLFEKYLGQIQYSLNLRSYVKKCIRDGAGFSCDLDRITVDINQTVDVISYLEERIVKEFQELLGVK